jgi:transitional endoplasmic reticulum ATPase
MKPGTAISKNVKISSCQNVIGDAEVYKLSNNKQLLVLPYLASKQQVHKSYRRRLLNIKAATADYFAMIAGSQDIIVDQQFIDKLFIKTGLDAVAGMHDLKKVLQEQVILPQQNPEKFLRFKVSIPNGILLYGPPGCGKTYIVRKLAEELGYSFFEMVPSAVATPYIHGNVSNVANMFANARAAAPAIIFIDEIEGLIPKREDLSSYSDIKREEINEFLVQLNNAGQAKVLVIGATNTPDLIDNALLRAGRLDKKIYVGPPDFEARKELFAMYLAGRPCSPRLDLNRLAELTEGYSSSDIVLVTNEAARMAVIGNYSEITQVLLEKAVKLTASSLKKSQETTTVSENLHIES